MKIRNTNQPTLTFKSAVIVDFEGSNQSCHCSRDYDALSTAVNRGLISKKGAIAFEIPVIKNSGLSERILDGDKYIVANEAEKEALEPLWRNLKADWSPNKAKAFIQKTQEFIKAGAKTIKY